MNRAKEILIDCSIAQDRGTRGVWIEMPPRLAFDRSARTTDIEGRLHVKDCILSVAEVSEYLGSEIPDYQMLGLSGDKIYKLYRTPGALKEGAPSFENMPLMSEHVGVNSAQPQKALIAGSVSNIRWKAPQLIGDIAVWEATSISGILDGSKSGLSCGYRYQVDMSPGKTPAGELFDGRMLGPLVCNHVALVENPRVPSATVNDSRPQFHTANVLQQLQNIRDQTQHERERSPLAKLFPGYYRI